jgi:hypothetical protein
MNADLENTLAGLGADARRMVAAMKGAFPEERRAGGERHGGRGVLPWFAAASGLAAASVAAVFAFRAALPPAAENGGVHPRAPREYTLALAGRADDIVEIIRTQRPDGSWGNDFLTAQNALALERHGETGVPYRRAKRYLRSRGL